MLASKDINDLISIVAALRNRESGCTWNIKQTFESIIPYMLEEAYEVIDAIERGNRTDLCEELGDLLLQVVYHAMIATEERSFTFEDVVYAITAKMIRRHPHIFGNAEQKSRGFVEGMWEHIKKIEKAEQKKQYEEISVPDNELASYLIQVKSAQPTDKEALALQKTAAEVGFESYDSDKIFAKIKEELNTLKEAIKIKKKSDIEIEFGDLYFTLLNLARHLNIDPQKALKKTNIKFRNRFANIEENLLAQSKMLTDVSSKEMKDLWKKAKNAE
ncbi:nucleoside triphosphate pyrophosphohydrolase [Bartonella sp. 1-1C]|uniref:nucleoside triphosphate pyrophosphohydrolase n=1 Tax=Bartonella sp. 1-1C TaxID=515256 RepID=UPI0001F4CC8B|nr:nucleoside triphosphate pyrophosphohydrolase [Bartonella sp. 1-1C]ATO57286.1 ATP diphosphatase [Bartonella sp. 1-1C]CBI80980.1 MazG protein [Bartonella sp. 1-1C]